jgi:energy-coupling factor transporter ATP-binding protein EcfA2
MRELRGLPINTMIYWLAGLRIASELPLSGLAIGDSVGTGSGGVTIRRASVPTKLTAPVVVHGDAQYDGKVLLLTIPNVARYLIREGTDILVDAEPDADQNDICAYLLGSALGALCHQRGIVPLHSAAIDINDGCAAFIGPSGAGKSTLAAALAARGHQVVADDVGFLQIDSHGTVMFWPGIGRIRLWEDAVAALDCRAPGVEREHRGYNKYLVPIRPPADPFTPRQLRRVYNLDLAPAESTATINEVQGAAAFELLMQNIYRSSYAEFMQRKPAAFAICAAMARQLPLFQFSRQMRFEVLNEAVELLERHLLDEQQLQASTTPKQFCDAQPR